MATPESRPISPGGVDGAWYLSMGDGPVEVSADEVYELRAGEVWNDAGDRRLGSYSVFEDALVIDLSDAAGGGAAWCQRLRFTIPARRAANDEPPDLLHGSFETTGAHDYLDNAGAAICEPCSFVRRG